MKPEQVRPFTPGLVPYTPVRVPAYADPDTALYKVVSAGFFGLALFGRHYCQSLGLPRFAFTANAIAVPLFYLAALNQKEKKFAWDNQPRKTFEQDLEWYPVTRRAWNRALEI